jgi:hypothetical protein
MSRRVMVLAVALMILFAPIPDALDSLVHDPEKVKSDA